MINETYKIVTDKEEGKSLEVISQTKRVYSEQEILTKLAFWQKLKDKLGKEK